MVDEGLEINSKISCKLHSCQELEVEKHTIRKLLAFSPLDFDMITRLQVS